MKNKTLSMMIIFFCIHLGSYAQIFDSIKTIADSIRPYNTNLLLRADEGYTTPIPQIKPVSPQAAQYMKYGEIPIGLSTGVPEITIPLYTIKSGSLELPINISYHASGNRLKDRPGIIGLGWVLNAGGIITQTIFDTEDGDLNHYLFTSAQKAITQLRENEQLMAKPCDRNNPTLIPYCNLNSYWYSLATDPSMSASKLVSDRFFYNFNGNTGVFRTDIETDQIVSVPHSPLKIKKIGASRIDTIEITDTSGNIWKFKRFETVVPSTGIIHSVDFYPTSILIPNVNEEIRFTYDFGQVYYQEGDLFETYTTKIQDYLNSYIPNCSYQREIQLSTYNWLRNIILKKIECRDKVIDFHYKTDRQDINIAKQNERLDQITITSSDNSVPYTIQFYNGNTYLGNDQDKNYRMQLESVQVNENKYSFKYKNEIQLPNYEYNDGTIILERKNQEDFWGYYNASNSSYFIPFDFSCNYLQGGNGVLTTNYVPSREPNLAFTQAGIIKEIIYPTGGKSVFEFEQNKGTDVYNEMKPSQPETDYFGGLRIKKLTTFDHNGKLVNTKNYEYEGGPTKTITPLNFIKKKPYYHWDNQLNSIYIDFGQKIFSSSNPIYPITPPNSQSVFYHKVTEYIGIPGSYNGKKEYYFDGEFNKEGLTLSEFQEDGVIAVNLINEKTFQSINDDFTLIKEVKHNYDLRAKHYKVGVKINFEAEFSHSLYQIPTLGKLNAGAAPEFYPYYFSNFEIRDVVAIQLNMLLSSTTIFDYTNNGTYINSTEYKYDPSLKILSPIEIITQNSDSEIITETITHPFHYNTAPYTEMTSLNMISPVITKTKSNTKEESIAINNNYRQEGRMYVIDNVVLRKNNIPEERLKYTNYDSYGNPIYLTQDSLTHIVYLWSYSGQYPVAEIKNATYTQVNTALASLGLTSIDALSKTSTPNIDKLRELRTLLTDAMVSVYTYQPLVGMLSSTDPQGITTYYSYDAFGRLKETYLMENGVKKVLQVYDYHYSNQ